MISMTQKMTVGEVSQGRMKKTTRKELLNMHHRTHQLYGNAKKNKDQEKMMLIIKKHDILVNEMDKRGMTHKTPLP